MKHAYEVVFNQTNSPSTQLLTLRNTEPGKPFGFQPGQYVVISYMRRGRPTPARCFSIVSSPTDQDTLQLGMRIKGRFTKGLAELKAGDPVEIQGPFGSFVFDGEKQNRVVILAGGIGITPFMSMLSYANRLKLDNKIILLYSCQNDKDIPFESELIKLQKENPNFKLAFVLTEGNGERLSGQIVLKGRIDQALLKQATSDMFKDKTFFICGPPGFMKAMSASLIQMEAPSQNVLTEAFTQGSSRQTGKLHSWPFNVYLLTTLGMAVGAFIVTIGDLMKALPPLSSFVTAESSRSQGLTNLRQNEVDKIVNNTPPTISQSKQVVITKHSSTGNTSQGGSTSTSSVAPAPKPALPAPVCTTSPSGITTCQ